MIKSGAGTLFTPGVMHRDYEDLSFQTMACVRLTLVATSITIRMENHAWQYFLSLSQTTILN